MTSLNALEKSLWWQQNVLANSKDHAQKARCRAAIARLQEQIERTKNEASFDAFCRAGVEAIARGAYK
jgi:hypothetical protein